MKAVPLIGIARHRLLCSPMVFGRAMIVTSSTRKYAKMNFISWRVAEESHLAVENLCYKANLSGNSANSVAQNGESLSKPLSMFRNRM